MNSIEKERLYQKEYHKKWYSENKVKRRKEIKNREDGITLWFKEYKSKLKCEKCEENHPACLEFHHKDPKSKELVIAYAARAGYSKERLLTEIEKCMVLCANCHRKMHW